ncbi:MAG: hypothetical protein V4567_01085 [Pseudomonadota bacterium]
MQSSNVPSNRRGQIIAACLLGALTMQTAMAGCPPGYRSKAGHCIPGPAQPHRPYVAKSNVHVPAGVSPWHTQPHTLVPKAIDRSKLKPQPGAPIEQHAGTSDQRGIIFVGGKNAINSQPVPPGKAALNPQPIPPGHILHPIPRPGAPVEKPAGHGRQLETTP